MSAKPRVKAAGKAADRAADKARGKAPSLIWLQGLACGALVTLATPLALELAILMLPVIGVMLLDRQPGKPLARAAFLFAAACCVGPVRALWDGSGDLSTAIDIATDPDVLARAWLAGGLGWVLAALMPRGLIVTLRLADKIQRGRLVAQRERLRAEWDAAE